MSVEAALQKAIVGKLKADAALSAIIAGRIYDRVPAGAALPYVAIRNIQAVEDGADCIDGLEVFIDLDVWSNAVGKVEASRAASAVRAALSLMPLVLDEPYALTEIGHRDTNIGDGGEEILTRARMTFRALVESA
ncbi:DUF3168 domain-containing protein [Microvirga lenta]|uniref:DUF3168 domain-containing protein n=1 Tax=Microvirga lenta TaxID=2881337 RepID=UPI001CFF3FDE|nr:DUF3168 domain-containing protein [Microvirga lenta]MCB5173645.1 DUF3168 domain-containing protein [Microvirga lenta]